jgi:hypothetical protein
VSGTETKLSTVYLIGLTPEEERIVWDDFRAYPFPGWQLSVLTTGVAPPIDLLEGRAILVIGCGGTRPPDHTETIWLLRLFVCANPWIAVALDPKQSTAELCSAAGAAAYLTRPFSPSKLREFIWHEAVPQAGRIPVTSLTCERLLRYCAALGSDVLLKFSRDNGLTGFLGLKHGQPFHAQLLDGPEGPDALHEILSWGKGKVLSLPLPTDWPANLPERSEAWLKLLRTPTEVSQPYRQIPGGSKLCNQVIHELSEISICVIVDLRLQRIVAQPSGQFIHRELEKEIVQATFDLLVPPHLVSEEAGPNEQVEEVLVCSATGWCAAVRLDFGSLAFVCTAAGQPQLVLARQVLNEAVDELERRSDFVVEDVVKE